MAIDIEKTVAAAVAERGEHVGKILAERTLLKQVLAGRSMADFETFFERFFNIGSVYLGLDNFPAMFGVWWMSRFRKIHLFWIYGNLRKEFRALRILGKFIADKRIPASRRAFFYHAVFESRVRWSIRRDCQPILPDFWWDNRNVWGEYVDRVRSDSPDAHIRRRGLSRRSKFEISDALAKTLAKDCVSAFEITRQLENRRLSDSLMQKLIEADAGRCFVQMLTEHPDKVFKLRSPEEWLFTVCRHARDGFAVAAVNELERQFPGIVARSRDPWGNTPLWSTFFNAGPMERLRPELIRFGCDPDSENASGLSYRLLYDNDPTELWEELSQSEEYKRLFRK